MNDSSDISIAQSPTLIIEACTAINERDAAIPRGSFGASFRASFNGLVADAPSDTTSVVNGLSQQLIHQLQLMLPNIFVSFDDLNVDLGNAAFAFVQIPARQALQKAIQDRGVTMLVNSAYRTVAQQMLLYNDRFNNPNPVAPPGASNHQTGLAIDIEDPSGWEPYLMQYGWNPLPGDPPHFDYQGGGIIDIRSKSILAFQQLWNQNYPNERISEDGAFGPQTENALNRTPAMGFAKAPWDNKPRTLRLCQPRLEGSDVIKLQESLKKAGFNLVADGEFGPATERAVKEFQKKLGLIVDGIVGPKTREKLA